MCKLYSWRSNRLLAFVLLGAPIVNGQLGNSFSIVKGYRNVERAWRSNSNFILAHEDGESQIQVAMLPMEEDSPFYFRVVN